MCTNAASINRNSGDVTLPSELSKVEFIPISHPNLNISQTKPIKKNPCKGKNRSHPWSCHSEAQIEFIDHVVMIWLNRVRRGDRKVIMPFSLIKARGKEVAQILNKFAKFSPTEWMRKFKLKIEQEDARGPKMYTEGYPSLKITDIVKEEWSQFFVDDSIVSGSMDAEKIEEKEESIQTYAEALECLKLVEEYAKSVQNLAVIELMAQIKDILRRKVDQ